jgi:hypothetical protein
MITPGMMQRRLILGAIVLVLIGTWSSWQYYKHLHPVYLRMAPINDHPPVQVPSDWRDYHATRVKTLQDNPDLAAEYKALLAEMADNQKKLEAAMIKADPKVGPILIRLAAIHQRDALPADPPLAKPTSAPAIK